jgi:hypothetical protein
VSPRRLFPLALMAMAAMVLGSARRREELLEQLKDGSDTLIIVGLRLTSEFGRELTRERQGEQAAYRRIRMRDLR